MVDSSEELKSSRSASGKNFPNFEMLDAKIASALNKIIQNSHIKKKVSLEEQKSPEGGPVSTRKTDCLHDPRRLSSYWRSWYIIGLCWFIFCCSSWWQHSGIRYKMGFNSIVYDQDPIGWCSGKSNKNRESKEVQRDFSHVLLDRLQEFRENLVDDESTSEELRRDLMQRSAHTSSSSHEPPMEPRAYVEPGSCKHSVFTHFPKGPNCEICLKTRITRASWRRRADAVMPRADISVIWLLQITKFQVKKVNRGTTIDMPWWYKTWQPSDYSPTRAKQNLPMRPRRA